MLRGQSVTRLLTLFPEARRAPSPGGYTSADPDGCVFVPEEVWLVEDPSLPGIPVHVLVAEGKCHTLIMPYDPDEAGGATAT